MVRRKRVPKPDRYVQFDNEAPRIGSGFRGVTILKIGRKWVRIKETATDRVARLPRRTWEDLTKDKRT